MQYHTHSPRARHTPACSQVLAISRGGLERRGRQEGKYLKELEAIAESGVTQADHLLSLYHGEWKESVDPIYSPEFTY